MTRYHESNLSMAYSSHLSWQKSCSPVPVYPSARLGNLFDNRGRLQNISISTRKGPRPGLSSA